MAVLQPLKVVIDNYPEDQVEELEAVNNPEDPGMGTRKVPFSRELYIEQDDFREDPPKTVLPSGARPGSAAALCLFYHLHGVVKDEKTGEIIELHCTYDPATRGGGAARRPQSQRHPALGSAEHAFDAEVRLYDYLFVKPDPQATATGESFLDYLNPSSLQFWPTASWNPHSPRSSRASAFNSSAAATSVLTAWSPGKGRRYSIAQSRCAEILGQDREKNRRLMRILC